jgi:nitrite reductase/ring-hydroxylating ferredoxin subunit
MPSEAMASEGKVMDFDAVVQTRDLGPGDLIEVQAHGRPLAVMNVGQTYYAFDPICPVDGTNLARAGVLDGDFLRCPADESVYDVRTGKALEGGQQSLQLYAVKVEDNEVMVGPPLD